ncbi:uncharacterized protein BXZ73DRAFT_93480 [Epithele typhae]|uniref:uncharacterized protein n=1 Tax=Epithele typhae TaxID=378194 RepID=UPI0020078BFA|nr:uncharacterized protein BXZ73DRAFT_93480 [Epithele typhae]KAH9911146.1 hypothetical protein BXZ73DRAFT_93480 [Epithele typhae]
MPFSRYLQSNEREQSRARDDDLDPATFSNNVHFQLPNLIFNAPTVPPGGGAEALPAGLYPPPPPSPAHSLPVSHFAPHQPLSVPSALGLPIYSASGFDLLSLLARVVTRPFPKICLGPVDLSCSFVVTDTRRFDAPIVYASPSFFKLTGYAEHEVIGRNCRFLQSPGGQLQRADERAHTSPDAVSLMRRNIIADKECQVSIINYRKDRSAFINMVSVIPLRGGVHNSPDEADDIVYHVGFQVDLTEQPKSILSKLKDGTYVVNYSDKPVAPASLASRDWRTSSMSMRGMSKDLRSLLADSAFTSSFHLSSSTHASTAVALSNSPPVSVALDPFDGNKPLHIYLLDRTPDFLHVVSLKGAFLYVAPAVRHVLGYDPDELVGRSLADFCHPADSVPLMRELKEASAVPGVAAATSGAPPPSTTPSAPAADGTPSAAAPRPVDLLFRIQAKGRGYVWIECRGRLHVEPGKGRKAIILSGRARSMPHLLWGPIANAGGLVSPIPRPLQPPSSSSTADGSEDPAARTPEREFWGLLSAQATFLSVGTAVRDVLGWGAPEMIGKRLADVVSGTSAHEVGRAIDVEMTKVVAGNGEYAGLACDVHTKEGGTVPVHVVLYCSAPAQALAEAATQVTHGVRPSVQAPIVCQVKLYDGAAPPQRSAIVHAHDQSVYDETDLERGSSWRYELQQLKFRNQRLVEEITALEASIIKKIRRKQTSAALGGVNGGRGSAGPRLTISFPQAQQSPAGQSKPPPLSTSLNVRFVPDTSGMPHSAGAGPSPSSRDPPTPVAQIGHRRPYAAAGAHPAPAASAARDERAGPGVRAPIGQMPLRMQQHSAADSTLHGWSSYPYGAGGGRRGREWVWVLPMKRSWDASMQDSGGGVGGGGA